MTHWPDITTLTIDCLFCAVSACQGSRDEEDQAFSKACRQEIDARLTASRQKLARDREERAAAWEAVA